MERVRAQVVLTLAVVLSVVIAAVVRRLLTPVQPPTETLAVWG